MIKITFTLLLLIVFVNPIFAQIKQLVKQRGMRQLLYKETELTIENLMALKPEIS
jgi:hypothetical protein